MTQNKLRKLVFTELSQYGFRVAFGAGENNTPSKDFDYDAAREIANSRFDGLLPSAVAFPRNAEEVAACLKFCRKHKLLTRTRSGGHQHEGMCTANGIFMIRTTEMYGVEFVGEPESADFAWIGVGTPLSHVYPRLAAYGKIIPGGGCSSVHIGGITPGGGWGSSARKYGMLCDSIEAFEVITADGKIRTVYPDGDHQDLFWAHKGGGGGNFGIVTRYKYRLSATGNASATVEVHWDLQHAEQVLGVWNEVSPEFPNEITSFLRVQVTEGQKKSVYFFARMYGTIVDLKNVMEPGFFKALRDLGVETHPEYKGTPGKSNTESDQRLSEAAAIEMMTYDRFDDGWTSTGWASKGLLKDGLDAGRPENCKAAIPRSTCSVPLPHKISSAYPKDDLDFAAMAAFIKKYIADTPHDGEVRQYISVMQTGGKIAQIDPDTRAYPYGHKPYILQIQSWWNYPCQERKPENPCISDDWENLQVQWAIDFRQGLKAYTEGAFINFVDAQLGPDPSTPKGRKELLRYYYGKNLEKLIDIKQKYDPDNVFSFEMSIPVE